ncbi:hypothetical protein EJ05DRAFT_473169 [Pseudovirgaria hyperparasitica]|uniref:Uncharacterized protein n=1 Tax=Pseudovirgaria hyperparasitica TaxID=470096 RepID=A0A6A6WIU3_9PEZI|nr:uncharacterized protein EJ05DRAFT_473169 [Pseudovirgaria hyperparasitica]KAF2762249.1 hypothetical protein EJ05DRAFT_473169 [Pseudovirgaria hyperparasitica]
MQDNEAVHDPDAGWKSKNRPQSTVARNFSAALDDLFKMDNDLDSLSKNVHQKKQAVTSQSAELEALEARLKAAEERLKNAGKNPAPFPNSRKNSQRRTPVKGAFGEDGDGSNGAPSSPLAQQSNDDSRQQTNGHPD